MEYSQETLEQGYALLNQRIHGVGLEPAPLDDFDYQQLVAWVGHLVRELLNRDMEKLLQICYRIDLPESKVKATLAEAPPESIHSELAELMVQRELQKVYFRQKYSS